MKKTVRLHDKTFELFIPHEEIMKAVKNLAGQIEAEVKETPVFIITLKGATNFGMDFAKYFNKNAIFDYIRLKSYVGTSTTGKPEVILDVTENIEGKDVYVLEDIVDTGNTLEEIIRLLQAKNPASVKIVALFFKPEAYTKDYELDYVGMSIPNKFIVGYGLDYNELGRNLNDIYQLKQ